VVVEAVYEPLPRREDVVRRSVVALRESAAARMWLALTCDPLAYDLECSAAQRPEAAALWRPGV
jgi:hypothetical protein